MKSYVWAVVLLVNVFAGSVSAQSDLINIARNGLSSYTYLDQDGVLMTHDDDPTCVKLTDGVRSDGNAVKIIPWTWKAGPYRGRYLLFDFQETAYPELARIVWMFSNLSGHVLDRVTLFAGDDVSSLVQVGYIEPVKSGASSTIIDVPLEGAAGRYLKVWFETDSNPDTSTMVSICEFEVYARKQFSDWIDDYAGYLPVDGREKDDDPDNDGLKNLIEFALGGNPSENDAAAIRPTLQISGGEAEYCYRRRVDWLPRGLSYSLGISTDLVSAAFTNDTSAYSVLGVSEASGDFEMVTNRIPITDEKSRFVTLMVE
ncbi:hypothetical protein [Tichowtungia aerotolerans]|uniref:Uncharacterized protein n=1 Tax=Tichowtungia aerotolerans TaxID=2697043 RepID=A0A6P1M2I4_9BACT|nr:hypothetical protein [Tichowtungia aerotolerans]QHI68037.1 hypothetical protein GT409_00745 [Tichowtungia aerotolerans]